MRLVTAVAVCLSMIGLAVAADAQAAMTKMPTNIPAQGLGPALKTLAKDRGFQVVFRSEVVGSARTQGAVGNLTTPEALTELLKGTDLSYSYLDENTVTIIASAPAATSAVADQSQAGVQDKGGSGKNSSQDFRVAQVDQANAGPQAVDDQNSEKKKKEEGLTEIVVTGTHIRGEAPIGSELIVIDRDHIEKSGYGRVEDVLATLTQNFGGVNENNGINGVPISYNDTGGAEVELRGLGVGTTLTLINGHRQPSGGGSLGTFVDISTIPTSAIERIEVLPDGASAIYGSDAIGGVVNIVLRKDYSGAESRVRFATADGRANETQLSQLFGTSWSSGNILVGYQYYKRDSLPCVDRALCATNGNLTAYGGSDFRLPDGNPGNILDPTTFNSAYAIPRGQNGTHLTVSQLIPGATNYYDSVSNAFVLPQQTLNSAFFNATQRIDDSLELFADGHASRREYSQPTPGTAQSVQVPSTNPFYVNPFEAESPGLVNVGYDFTSDLGPQFNTATVDAYSIASGMIVHLRNQWQLSATGTYGRDQTTRAVSNAVSFTALAQAAADSNPLTALNVFGDGSSTNPATLALLRTTYTHQAVADLGTVSVIADGPLFTVPAGQIKLAVGADYRNETLDATDIETSESQTPTAFYSARSSRHVSAAFAELAVPILGEQDAASKAGRLEFSASGRYEEYSDFGHTINPKLGLSWSPLQALTLRGSWGTSFRAPPFAFTNPAVNPPAGNEVAIPDPKSPTGVSNVLAIFGNNPNLKQETAHIWSTGLDIHPANIPDLKLSLTYFDIDYRNRISSFQNLATALEPGNIYASLITLNPTQAQVNQVCSTPAFQGVCTGAVAAIIDARYLNLAVEKTRGVDGHLSDSVKLGPGSLGVELDGTYSFNFDQAFTTIAPPIDVLNTVGNPLRLRLRGGLSWTMPSWSTGVTVNFTGGYQNPGITPDTVGSYTTVDLNFVYHSPVETGWFGRTKLIASAVNVLNHYPPFVNQAGGYDPANFNLLGRMLSIELVKGW